MSDFLDAFAAGIESGRIQYLDAHPLVVLGEGQKAHDLEAMLPQPLRKRGTVQLQDERSLTDYVAAHKAPGTVIFADPDQRKIVAVLNHHDPQEPHWSDFRAELQMQRTPEWKAWLAVDRKPTGQTEFVELLEDQIGTVLQPDGAELVEICQHLKGLKKVEFENGVSLRDGTVQLTYRETVDSTSSRKGQVEVPERLLLKLSLFRNDPASEVKARLRWRLVEGRVAFIVVLEKPVEAEDAAMSALCTRLAATLAVPVLSGKA